MSYWEYDLRSDGTGVRRVLMERLNWNKGDEVWKDVAVFSSYVDAERILRLIRLGLDARAPAAPGGGSQ